MRPRLAVTCSSRVLSTKPTVTRFHAETATTAGDGRKTGDTSSSEAATHQMAMMASTVRPE